MSQPHPITTLALQYRKAWEYLVKWSIISVAISIPAALSVWVLRTGVDVLFGRLCGDSSALVYLMPAVGGLVVGLILYQIDSRVSGEGVPRYVKAVLEDDGKIPFRIFPLKILATIASLGFGGSGGLVGPLAYAGGALGSSVGRALRKIPFVLPLQQSDLKIATICGVGAALGALLKAPVAGAILAGEILYATSLSYRDLFPAMLASASGYLVYCLATDFASFFEVYPFSISAQMVGYSALVGLTGGFVGIFFVQTQRVIRNGYDRCFLPLVLRPAAGGVVVGLLAWLVGRDIMSVGRPLFHMAVTGGGGLGLRVLILLLVGKMLATAFTVGSGGSGGLTFPTMVTGTLLGAVWGAVLQVSEPGAQMALSVAGLCALMGAVLNAPIAGIVLALEMFGPQYAIPAIIGAVLAFQIARPHVIFEYLEREDPPQR